MKEDSSGARSRQRLIEQLAWAHWVMGTNLCAEQKDGDVLSQPQPEYKLTELEKVMDTITTEETNSITGHDFGNIRDEAKPYAFIHGFLFQKGKIFINIISYEYG